MKNLFFTVALAQASRIAGKRGRLLQVVAQLTHRLVRMDRKSISAVELKERLQILGRLVAAYARGRYRVIPVKTLLILVAAVLYFLNPLDIVPDAILGVGLMDDLAVLTWVYRSAQQEVTKFTQWEKLRGGEIVVT
jgi:uncharacterized membrane protein YkvA (DUF1232 family)